MSALSDRRILVLEDDWFLAESIRDAIERSGGTVVGPVAGVAEALDLLSAQAVPPDAATLNVRVVDGESFPVADELARRGVPFLFASANSSESLPARFARHPLVAKPFNEHYIATALTALLRDGAPVGND